MGEGFTKGIKWVPCLKCSPGGWLIAEKEYVKGAGTCLCESPAYGGGDPPYFYSFKPRFQGLF